jgi:threonine/homoserine/homoserine lactone efflux protein
VLSAVGTVAVLNAFDGALHLLRIAGGAYLLVLGARTLWYALGTATSSDAPETSAVTLTPQAAFTQGLLSNLSNPKIAIFFGSLLSQFATTLMPLVGFGLLFCAMTLMWLTAYVLVVDTATFLRGPFARRTIEIIGGVALVALGLRFATERV